MADHQPDFPALENEAGITPVERDEIRAHIEKVATENRIPVEAAQFSLSGARRGVLLPFIVNAGAAIVVVAVILVLGLVFRKDERRVQTQATQYVSVEGKLIRELRQQSTELLSAKEKEIEEVRNKVRELEEQQKNLAETYSQKLKAKEEELRQKQAQDVSTERARLVSQGVGTDDLEKRMATFEAERKAYYEKQLAEYKKSLDAERTQLAADINRLRAEYEARLEQLQKERRQIVTDSQEREAALRVQLEQKTLVLDRLRAQGNVNLGAAQIELEQLGQKQENVQVVANQIDGQIGKIDQELGAGNAEAALTDVRALQDYLRQASVRSVAQLSDRIQSESLLLQQLGGLLEDRVRAQRSSSDQTLASQIEQLSTIRSLSQQAAALAGPAQLDVYRRLVASLPEVQSATAALVGAAATQAAEDLQKTLRDETQKNTEAAIRLMATEDYAGALARYKAALNASPAVAPDASQLLKDLLTLGYRMSDYVRTGSKAPGIDELAAQSGIDIEAERAAYIKNPTGALSEQEANVRAAADQQVTVAAAAQEQQLRSQIADAQSRIAQLETQQTQANAQHSAEIDTIAARVKATRQDLMKRLDALLSFEGEVNAARGAYSTYMTQEKAARAANPQDPATASRQELNKFLEAQPVRVLFSDVADRVSALYSVTQTAGGSAALADAADIITAVAKQPTVKASRQELQFEIQNAKGNDRLVAILTAVDGVLARAQGRSQ